MLVNRGRKGDLSVPLRLGVLIVKWVILFPHLFFNLSELFEESLVVLFGCVGADFKVFSLADHCSFLHSSFVLVTLCVSLVSILYHTFPVLSSDVAKSLKFCFRSDAAGGVFLITLKLYNKSKESLTQEQKGVSLVDWNKIKTEYITTDTSYRKLADKYNVSSTSICKVAKKEQWVTEKERYLNESYSKTIEAITKSQTERVLRLQTITDKILNKIEKSVELMDAADLQAFRQITATLKDIKEIQMLKSDADMREQEARIDKLRKDAQTEGNNREYGVLILPPVESN